MKKTMTQMIEVRSLNSLDSENSSNDKLQLISSHDDRKQSEKTMENGTKNLNSASFENNLPPGFMIRSSGVSSHQHMSPNILSKKQKSNYPSDIATDN